MSTDIEKEIREHWFKNHKATLTQHGNLQVLQWETPGTVNYSCRYVFDGHKMYISGDIGEAVFWLTWNANVHSFDDIHVHYFEEKLCAYSEDRRKYNGNKATRRLAEWKEQLDEDEIEYDKDIMEELIQSADYCSRKDEWAYEYVKNEYSDFISDLDCDYWEWIYDIGDEIPPRIHAYLIGLKMASKQLRDI